jgi:hypothetical protein
MKEYILCAAIWYKDGVQHVHQPKNIHRGFVICGRRHHNIIATAAILEQSSNSGCEQGFITNLDRYVDRKEAYKIAFKADQIKGPNKGQSENSIGLTSEDLY